MMAGTFAPACGTDRRGRRRTTRPGPHQAPAAISPARCMACPRFGIEIRELAPEPIRGRTAVGVPRQRYLPPKG